MAGCSAKNLLNIKEGLLNLIVFFLKKNCMKWFMKIKIYLIFLNGRRKNE